MSRRGFLALFSLAFPLLGLRRKATVERWTDRHPRNVRGFDPKTARPRCLARGGFVVPDINQSSGLRLSDKGKIEVDWTEADVLEYKSRMWSWYDADEPPEEMGVVA